MAKDPIGFALGSLTRIAGSPWLDRAGLRKPFERLVFTGSRAGFSTLSAANRRFKPLMRMTQAARLETPSAPERFDLTPTDEQRMFQETVARLVDEAVSPGAAAADEADATPQDLLQQVHDLGIGLLAIPEEAGGAGAERSPITHTLVMQELARGDMGIALAALAPLGVANALVEWGDAGQQDRYLTHLAGDDFIPATLAVSEPDARFDPFRLTTKARRNGEGYEITGVKAQVPLGADAELMLVAADLEGQGPRLFCVEAGTPHLHVTPEPTMGLRAASLARVELRNAKLPSDALLGGKESAFDYERFIALSRIAWAALTVGGCQAVLDYVAPYVKERKAFGEPIAHRQSVAFMVANIGLELEGMRLMAWRAAARAEHGQTFHREAYLTSLQAAEKGMRIGTDGVQLLGGHGYVKEHPVERWYRNLRGTAVQYNGLMV